MRESIIEQFFHRVDAEVLQEAFRVEDYGRVIVLIQSYLNKAFKSECRVSHDEEYFTTDLGNFVGVNYYFANGSRIRIGFRGMSSSGVRIGKIDYWASGFTPTDHPTIVIPFHKDANIQQILRFIPLIKTFMDGKQGKSMDVLLPTPTASMTPEDLVISEALQSNSKEDQIREMLKIGKNATEILSTVGDDPENKAIIKKTAEALGMTVKASVRSGNASDTGKPSPIENAKVQKNYRLVPKYSDPTVVYEDLDLLLDAVVNQGKFNALLVTGSTGTGKTQNITNFLKRGGMVSSDEAGEDMSDYKKISGGNVTGLALYQSLFDYRKSGKVILIDDADAAFDDSTKNNILKSALDSYDARYISWESNNPNIVKVNGSVPIEEGSEEWNKMIADGKYPNRFKYSGQIIIISNIPYYEFDKAVRGRTVTIDITIKSEDMINRIQSTLMSGKEFAGISKEASFQALKFMTGLPGMKGSKAGEYYPGTEYSKDDYVQIPEDTMEINYRTFMTVAKFADLGFPEQIWQRLAEKYAGIPSGMFTASE